jgi:hypothetical protein
LFLLVQRGHEAFQRRIPLGYSCISIQTKVRIWICVTISFCMIFRFCGTSKVSPLKIQDVKKWRNNFAMKSFTVFPRTESMILSRLPMCTPAGERSSFYY